MIFPRASAALITASLQHGVTESADSMGLMPAYMSLFPLRLDKVYIPELSF